MELVEVRLWLRNTLVTLCVNNTRLVYIVTKSKLHNDWLQIKKFVEKLYVINNKSY